METFPKFNREVLKALKARDLPKLRAADLFSKTDAPRTPEEEADANKELDAWDAYLAQFVARQPHCICCGTDLRCPLGMGWMGGFEWGLAHGSGHCRFCGYPMQGHHRVKDVGTIKNLFLQRHPETLSFVDKGHPDPSGEGPAVGSYPSEHGGAL